MTHWDPGELEKKSIDSRLARKLLADLRAGRSHKRPCTCHACLYRRHRAAGGRFDVESFWLDWLEFEVRLSMVDTRERHFWQDYPRPELVVRHLPDWPRIYKLRGVIEAMARFLALEFPKINHDEDRLRMKLWRLKKSGVMRALEQEAVGEIQAVKGNTMKGTALPTLRLAKRVAEYVYSRPDRTASQRELQRQFHRPVEILGSFIFRRWLFVNYRIESRHEGRKNRVIYRGTV